MRKKLNWPYQPFEVPEKIFDEWRKIGLKGDLLEKKWLEQLNKSNEKIKSEFNKFNNKIFKEDLNRLITSEKEKYFIEKPTLATRQCSMKVIESISDLIPNLIGGSADLSGSNNTKTKNSVVINSKILMETISITELENMVWRRQ